MNEQLALVPLDLNGSSLFYFPFVRCLSTLVSITTEGAVVNSGSLWFTFDLTTTCSQKTCGAYFLSFTVPRGL